MKVTVKVPATSANVGPAFDCAGFAVNLYNEITVERKLAKPFSCRAEGEFSGETSGFGKNNFCAAGGHAAGADDVSLGNAVSPDASANVVFGDDPRAPDGFCASGCGNADFSDAAAPGGASKQNSSPSNILYEKDFSDSVKADFDAANAEAFEVSAGRGGSGNAVFGDDPRAADGFCASGCGNVDFDAANAKAFEVSAGRDVSENAGGTGVLNCEVAWGGDPSSGENADAARGNEDKIFNAPKKIAFGSADVFEAFNCREIRLFTDANGTLEESFDLGLVQKTKNEFFKKIVEKFTENGQNPLFFEANGGVNGQNGDFSGNVKDSGFVNVDFACEKNADFSDAAARVGGCDFVPETFEITVKTNVPPARGLGSSATIIVGVLKGLNALYGNVLTDRELAEVATAVEGHPDNVVPALFGGFVFSFAQDDGKVDFSRHNFISGVKIFALIPDFELKTSVSRGVLPKMIKYETAVYNLKQTAELFAALTKNDKALFSKALHDKLHQPYREKCIPGMSELIRQIPCAAGVLGCVLSGAGPTLAVFSEGGRIELEKIAGDVWQRSGIKFEIKELEPDNEGATVIFDE